MKKYSVNLNVYPIDTTVTVTDAIMVITIKSGLFHVCLIARIPYFLKSLRIYFSIYFWRDVNNNDLQIIFVLETISFPHYKSFDSYV